MQDKKPQKSQPRLVIMIAKYAALSKQMSVCLYNCLFFCVFVCLNNLHLKCLLFEPYLTDAKSKDFLYALNNLIVFRNFITPTCPKIVQRATCLPWRYIILLLIKLFSCVGIKYTNCWDFERNLCPFLLKTRSQLLNSLWLLSSCYSFS